MILYRVHSPCRRVGQYSSIGFTHLAAESGAAARVLDRDVRLADGAGDEEVAACSCNHETASTMPWDNLRRFHFVGILSSPIRAPV